MGPVARSGHELVFATEAGATPACDPLLLTGVVFGKLGARADAIALVSRDGAAPGIHRAAHVDATVAPIEFDALFLAGGHAPGMRQYLGSELVQPPDRRVLRDRQADRGDLSRRARRRAREAQPTAGVLHGVKTTCLPKYMERAAFLATFWRRGRYYRTYPHTSKTKCRAALATPDDFVRGPRELSKRGTRDDDSHAFVVEDGRYISARWPGDAYLIAKKLIERLASLRLTQPVE